VREIHYDEARVPAYTLPDPLRFADGRPVAAADWPRRRAEILHLFEEHVYGAPPPGAEAARARWETVEEGAAFGGRALRRQLRGRIECPAGSVELGLLLYVPAATDPVPAFLGLNFGGNHTLGPDSAVLPPRAGERPEAARGSAAGSWPLETILGRGYGLATLHCADAEPDHPRGWEDGVRGLFPGGSWGALGAWAYGLSRALDALREEPLLDGARVAVIGHSRLGKAALWAGARDERFALVVSNNSGCGGAALSRREFGETVARINASFPHWFSAAFRRYDDREGDLPVDQHMLLALVAPRPLYVASALEDRWADPRGEFLAAAAANPVYRLLGTEGLGTAEMPPPLHPVCGRIGYHIRPGGHGLTPYDWDGYLEFADRHLRTRPCEEGSS